jgi:hypothetical protein
VREQADALLNEKACVNLTHRRAAPGGVGPRWAACARARTAGAQRAIQARKQADFARGEAAERRKICDDDGIEARVD